MTELQTAISDYSFHCRHERNLSAKTLKFYGIDLRQFDDFLLAGGYQCQIKLIDKTALKRFLESLSEMKPKTIKRKMATIKAFFNHLEFEDKIIVNPFRKLRIKIKEPQVLPTVMTKKEIRKIFGAVYTNRKKKQNKSEYSDFESIRNIAVIELLFSTGIRVSELSFLKTENIDLQAGFVKVNGKGSRERVIHICQQETLSVLKEYSRLVKSQFAEAGGYFFINRNRHRLSDQSIRTIVRKLATAAGINKRITPHIFRHSLATLLLEEDVDIRYIQQILGHSTIMTTQIYAHVHSQKQLSIMKNKHPRKNWRMVPEREVSVNKG